MKSCMIGIVIPLLAIGIFGCYSSCNVTRGTVMMRTTSEGYINLGDRDGIRVGDTLKVLRHLTVGKTTQDVCMGEARVMKILDMNHSSVEILNGNVNEQDIVEKLRR